LHDNRVVKQYPRLHWQEPQAVADEIKKVCVESKPKQACIVCISLFVKLIPNKFRWKT